MRLPRIDGVVERRLLVNYRVDPAAVARILPPPFRPQLVNDYAVAGICLIRMGSMRPAGLPAWMGRRSENAAHRIAVQWDSEADGQRRTRTGVYIPRRDSNSLLNTLGGGRLFPGEHHAATFSVDETESCLRLAYTAKDDSVRVAVEVDLADELVGSELFADLAAASSFFQQGGDGFSDTHHPGRHDGLRLHAKTWSLEPCRVKSATSSFFENRQLFSPADAVLDSALVMRGVPVTWTGLPSVRAEAARVLAA